jgi:hypothetical protein
VYASILDDDSREAVAKKADEARQAALHAIRRDARVGYEAWVFSLR